MIYKFNFIDKLSGNKFTGQVCTDNFYKWFMEQSPYGVRLDAKPIQLQEAETGINDFTQSFQRKDFLTNDR